MRISPKLLCLGFNTHQPDRTSLPIRHMVRKWALVPRRHKERQMNVTYRIIYQGQLVDLLQPLQCLDAHGETRKLYSMHTERPGSCTQRTRRDQEAVLNAHGETRKLYSTHTERPGSCTRRTRRDQEAVLNAHEETRKMYSTFGTNHWSHSLVIRQN
jgi:hypothetical protein